MDTMLYGGPTEPEDNCYWAGNEFIAFLETAGFTFTPAQQEELAKYRSICDEENIGAGEDEDDDD